MVEADLVPYEQAHVADEELECKVFALSLYVLFAV